MDLEAKMKDYNLTYSDLDSYSINLIDRTVRLQQKLEEEKEQAEAKDEPYTPNERMRNRVTENIDILEDKLNKINLRKKKVAEKEKEQTEVVPEAKAEKPKEKEKVGAETTTEPKKTTKVGWWDWK